MKEIKLVPAKPGDEKLIHSMKYSSFLPLYERYREDETSPVKEPIDKVTAQLKSKGTDYYIITVGSEPVGGVKVAKGGVETGERVYRISPLFIVPEYQNRGIGYRVIMMLFEMYGDAGIWRLSTVKQEKGNCHLYEKCGFEQVGNETQINDRMTIVYYEKIKRSTT